MALSKSQLMEQRLDPGSMPSYTLLKKGSTGTDVKRLQQKLNALGFNVGTADGIFGAKTAAAVKAYQQAAGLTADGLAGNQTLSKIYSPTPLPKAQTTTAPISPALAQSTPAPSGYTALQTGSRGADVKKLQTTLNSLGFNAGTVDGIYGSKTAAAVSAYQKATGITSSGAANNITLNKLYSTAPLPTVKPAATTPTTTTKPATGLPGSTSPAIYQGTPAPTTAPKPAPTPAPTGLPGSTSPALYQGTPAPTTAPKPVTAPAPKPVATTPATGLPGSQSPALYQGTPAPTTAPSVTPVKAPVPVPAPAPVEPKRATIDLAHGGGGREFTDNAPAPKAPIVGAPETPNTTLGLPGSPSPATYQGTPAPTASNIQTPSQIPNYSLGQPGSESPTTYQGTPAPTGLPGQTIDNRKPNISWPTDGSGITPAPAQATPTAPSGGGVYYGGSGGNIPSAGSGGSVQTPSNAGTVMPDVPPPVFTPPVKPEAPVGGQVPQGQPTESTIKPQEFRPFIPPTRPTATGAAGAQEGIIYNGDFSGLEPPQLIDIPPVPVAESNKYWDQLQNMQFNYDLSQDREYLKASAQAENAIIQNMIARGGLYSSIAQSAVANKIMDLGIEYEQLAYDKFLQERDAIFKYAQFEQNLIDTKWQQGMTIAEYQQNQLYAQWEQKYKNIQLSEQIYAAQWERALKSAEFEYQQDRDRWNQEYEIAKFEEAKAVQLREEAFQREQFNYKQALDIWEQQFKNAQVEYQKELDKWNQTYQMKVFNANRDDEMHNRRIQEQQLSIQKQNAAVARQQAQAAANAAAEQRSIANLLEDHNTKRTEVEIAINRWKSNHIADKDTARILADYGVQYGMAIGAPKTRTIIKNVEASLEAEALQIARKVSEAGYASVANDYLSTYIQSPQSVSIPAGSDISSSTPNMKTNYDRFRLKAVTADTRTDRISLLNSLVSGKDANGLSYKESMGSAYYNMMYEELASMLAQ